MPALDTAAGGISIAKTLLAATLAACTQWQTDTGSANAAAALTHIYYDAVPPPDNGDKFGREELIDLRPFAIISTNPFESGYTWHRDAAEAWDDSNGRLILDFEYQVDDSITQDDQAVMRRFENSLGKIVKQESDVATMTSLAHQPGYLAINSISLEMVGRANEKAYQTQGDFVFARFNVLWGVRG